MLVNKQLITKIIIALRHRPETGEITSDTSVFRCGLSARECCRRGRGPEECDRETRDKADRVRWIFYKVTESFRGGNAVLIIVASGVAQEKIMENKNCLNRKAQTSLTV